MNKVTKMSGLSNSAQQKLEKVRANVIKILQTRFKDLPEQVIQDVNSIDDISLLEKLFNNSIIVADFEDFQQNSTLIPRNLITPIAKINTSMIQSKQSLSRVYSCH